MGCRSRRAGHSVGRAMRRLRGVGGTWGLWASRWGLRGSCCEIGAGRWCSKALGRRVMNLLLLHVDDLGRLMTTASAARGGMIACRAFCFKPAIPFHSIQAWRRLDQRTYLLRTNAMQYLLYPLRTSSHPPPQTHKPTPLIHH